MKGEIGDVGKHIHHERLVEIYNEPQESRETYIRLEKPEHEWPTRLRLIGVIPDQYLPQEVLTAREIFKQAEAAYNQVGAAYNQVGAACNQAWAAYNQALAAYNQAWAALDQAWAACHQAWAALDQAISNNREHFESTHHLWCVPDCPWNGRTIFPPEKP